MLPSFNTNLIDTYETVTIDVLIALLISLSSVSFYISIFVIHTHECVNLRMHFPPLPYPYTFIDILICMLVSTIIIINFCVPAARGKSRAHVWMSTSCAAIKLE